MNPALLFENMTNPAFLFFLLGILAVYVKSDLQIPSTTSKFIAIYLLFSIGFNSGQELSHQEITIEILASLLFGILIAALIPLYVFFIAKIKLPVHDSIAIASAYGSVSAVTFVTAVSYLEAKQLSLHGHMVAVMALMESPAIIVGLILLSLWGGVGKSLSWKSIMQHSFANASVLLILGSLLIGYIANAKQAAGITPFTSDLFKGFLSIFLLDMGLICGKEIKRFFAFGTFPLALAIALPLLNGCIVGILSTFITQDISNQFIFAILGASASYIAVPAAMNIAVPEARPSLYVPMALAITFPINITIGFPLYMQVIGLMHE
ncbi:MAG: sodium-dependent bicarbonate transport family permease [Candidatus Kapaibacteriota bacterium]